MAVLREVPAGWPRAALLGVPWLVVGYIKPQTGREAGDGIGAVGHGGEDPLHEAVQDALGL